MGIVLLISLGFVGLLALAIGLRGRRVGTAAHCRKCRFDLTGVYPEHLICPECGAGLEEPRAIRTGRWVRRQKLLVAGVLLLGVAATLGTMSARGGVTKSKIARALPTGALVALAIDRPDGWLAAEGRTILFLRVALDKLSPAQCASLADALFGALSRPDFPEYRFHCDLLDEVVMMPSTPKAVRQRYADFLVDRVVRTDLPWVHDWGGVLMAFRTEGLVTDEVWESVLTELITPRLWCSSGGLVGGVVEPGEVFVLRTSSLSNRLWDKYEMSGWRGVFLVRPEPVEGVSRLPNAGPMIAVSQYGPGPPDGGGRTDELLVAGSEPFAGEFVVRVQYAEEMMNYADVDPRIGLTHPGTLTVESRLAIEVRPAAAPASPTDTPPTVERWLQTHLLPASRSDERRTLYGSPGPLGCRIAVLAPVGDLVLRGSLVVVDRSGSRTTIGTFNLERTGAMRESRWTGIGNNSRTVFAGVGESRFTLPEIQAAIPVECLLPEGRTRAVLVFDHVMLPDGRTFDATQPGTAPIEIDVPFDPDAGGFDW